MTSGSSPEPNVPLSEAERDVWLRFLDREVRKDVAAAYARLQLTGTLDAVAEEVAAGGDGWCGCPGHVSDLEQAVARLWLR